MIKGIFKVTLIILLFGIILISEKTRDIVGISLKQISLFLLWTFKYGDKEKLIIHKSN